MNQPRSLLANFPLFIVLVIDSMGLGLLFPILNSIIVDPVSAFLPAATTIEMRDFLYGLTVGIFMLCWFFGAAILGDLSDTVGRKKALIICLLGSCFGYLVAGLAIDMHSLWLLLVGRVIAGFTAGSQPIAQAAIVDISYAEHRARNIGLILLAVSLGFVLGPIIGGVLSDARVESWFTFSTPMYFAAIVSLLNALLLWLTFKETFRITGKVQIKFDHAVQVFMSAFKNSRIRRLSVAFFVMIFGWSNFYTFLSMFLINRYQLKPIETAFFMCDLGVGFSIGCGYLVDICAKRFIYKKTVMVTAALTALGVLVVLLARDLTTTAIAVLFIGITVSIAYSTLITMFSNQVSDDEQGWVMGVTGAIMALCFGVNALLTGLLVRYYTDLPMVLALFGLAISVFLIRCFRPVSGKQIFK